MSGACKQWEERLLDLLYDDGDEAARIATRAHLAECAGCRAEIESLGGTRRALSAWPNAVNVPRMIYVNEAPARPTGWRGWLGERLGSGRTALLGSALAAAAMLLLGIALATALDLRVAPDGTLRIGRLASAPALEDPDAVPITRAALQEHLAEVVSHLEGVLDARGDEERRLLLAGLDERIEEQEAALGRDLTAAVETAFVDLRQQHEGDLGLIFSAIDEMGLMTASELQQISAFLGTLAVAGPAY